MKKLFALYFILIAYELISMEAPQAVCYLACLPVEVQNIIGEYLVSEETDEKFIARNRANGWGSEYHWQAQNYERINGTFSGESWNYQYEVYYDRCSRHRAQLLVRHQDRRWESYHKLARSIYDDEEYSQIIDITVSSDGEYFAKIAQTRMDSDVLKNASQVKINVYRLADGAKKEFIIPVLLDKVLFLGINKQNTKVVTHGRSGSLTGHTPYVFAFGREYEKTNNRLNDYFKCNRVCKKLASSLPPVSKGDKNED